jgi:hypothetical protein
VPNSDNGFPLRNFTSDFDNSWNQNVDHEIYVKSINQSLESSLSGSINAIMADLNPAQKDSRDLYRFHVILVDIREGAINLSEVHKLINSSVVPVAQKLQKNISPGNYLKVSFVSFCLGDKSATATELKFQTLDIEKVSYGFCLIL